MLKIENLNISYGENNPTVRDFSLSVEDGQCVVFAGKSGSGKTSIINAINGLGRRYYNSTIEGLISIDGVDIATIETYKIAQMISTVFQNPKTHFFNVNTTLELVFYLENIGLSRREMLSRLDEMMKIFPIKHLLDRDIFKLSGGEKQILCIASSYMSGNKILLLDEPSSNLDDKYIEILKSMLQKLKSEGFTIIVSEHRLYYLTDVMDQLVVIGENNFKKYSKKEVEKFSEEFRRQLGLRALTKPKLYIENIDGKGSFNIEKLDVKFDEGKGMLSIGNLAFERGKIYGIVGYNGCGKSTLIKSLIGLNKKSKERINLDGKLASRKNRLKMSSLVMQDVNHQLFTDEVGREIELGIKNPDIVLKDKLTRQLGIEDLTERHPFSLSGGQKQRVIIAATLLKRPFLNFFDEPTSGMDLENMEKISKLIKDISSEENIIFIVSHDVEFLNLTADYIVNIENFRF